MQNFFPENTTFEEMSFTWQNCGNSTVLLQVESLELQTKKIAYSKCQTLLRLFDSVSYSQMMIFDLMNCTNQVVRQRNGMSVMFLKFPFLDKN